MGLELRDSGPTINASGSRKSGIRSHKPASPDRSGANTFSGRNSSNRAGVNLSREGAGNLFCVAAVGAGIPDKMDRARTAGRRVVIDGCEDHCGRKIMETAGLPVELHVDVTTLGVEKKPGTPAITTDAKRVVELVTAALA